MPADPRLAALPALRKLAEEMAREQYEAEAALAREQGLGDTPDEPGDWAWLVAGYPRMSSLRVEATLALLSDLQRPASRDALVRLVAEAVGLTCGATAPTFIRRGGHRQIELRGEGASHYFGEDLCDWPGQHPMALTDADLADPIPTIALSVLA